MPKVEMRRKEELVDDPSVKVKIFEYNDLKEAKLIENYFQKLF